MRPSRISSEMAGLTRSVIRITALLCMVLAGVGCGARQHTAITSGNFPSTAEREEVIPQPLPETSHAPEPFSHSGPGQKADQAPLGTPQEVNPLIVAKEKPESPELRDQPIPRSVVPPVPQEPQRPAGTLLSPSPPSEVGESTPSPESSQVAAIDQVPSLAQPANLEGIPRRLTDIFFDYDQYAIRSDAIPVMEMNAKVLIARFPDKKILIQGHCDERGTEEYNLVLGERRAQMVKDYLVDLGVPPQQIDVLSYGKTKPFCLEHSLKCWQQNRRGHFVFQ